MNWMNQKFFCCDHLLKLILLLGRSVEPYFVLPKNLQSLGKNIVDSTFSGLSFSFRFVTFTSNNLRGFV